MVAVHLARPEASVAASDAAQSEKLWAYAKCDGTDDHEEINAAIARVSSEVRLSHGTFDIAGRLSGKTDVEIVGQGRSTIIQANQAWGGGANALRAMVEFIGIDRSGLRDLVLDMQGDGRLAAKGLGLHAFISNASHINVDRVVFQGGGYDNATNPSGPCVALVSESVDGDFTSFYPAAVVGSVANCAITRCVFEQKETSGGFSFAIRVLSDWLNLRDPDTGFGGYYNHGHLISENRFLANSGGDGFDWNTIELAGGATRDVVVSRNWFRGKTLSHIDVDKGANGNTVLANHIESGGKADIHVGDADTMFAAIAVHGTGDDYLTTGNAVLYNRIRDCVNAADADIYQSLILIEYARDTQVIGNRGRNLNDATIGRGVHLGYTTPGTTIALNKLRSVLLGIATNSQATSREGVSVADNDIESAEQGIYFGGSTPGSGNAARAVVIKGNRVKIASTTLAAISVFPEVTGVVLEGNTVQGGLEGLYINATNVTAVANVIRSNTHGIRLLQGSGILIGNINYAANALTPAANVFPAVNHGNNWNPKVTDGTAAPTTGTWAVGDRVENTTPAAAGYRGWICVTAGTPGTWKGYGLIES